MVSELESTGEADPKGLAWASRGGAKSRGGLWVGADDDVERYSDARAVRDDDGEK